MWVKCFIDVRFVVRQKKLHFCTVILKYFRTKNETYPPEGPFRKGYKVYLNVIVFGIEKRVKITQPRQN